MMERRDMTRYIKKKGWNKNERNKQKCSNNQGGKNEAGKG